MLFCVALFTQSCSRKKDKFISRNYHALTTKYNILYNGNIALEKGKASVNNQYTENFWELLPIERMTVSDDFFVTDENKNADFERAEDKAIKSIQKHGMNIEGREKNPQMDEAYLLLGKARYYDQRFVPALAAFNNILNKYPTSDKINQVKIWREKANMRLDNDEIAIEKLKRLLKEETLKDQDLADATATLAQAYLNIKAKDSALIELAIAAKNTKIKNERARYHFIRGQLYNEFDKNDSANIEFDKIIDMHRQIPRAFYINAHLQKSLNFDTETGNLVEFEDYLTDLEENRENRPFLDKIYHRIAEFHKKNKSDSLSEVYYNKSLLKSKVKDNYLSALNYETLGDMYFDYNNYKTAGAYYDSTLTKMVEKTKPYRVIKKKRENLDDVIYYEDVVKANDSILYMVSLPKDKQLEIYTKLTEQLKVKAFEEAQLKQEALDKRKNAASNSKLVSQNSRSAKINTNPRASINKSIGSNGKSNFYFYNATTVAYGKNEFLKLWGDRKLQDNWRFSSERADTKKTDTKEDIASLKNEVKFNPENYINQLPTKQSEIDSIFKERNYANYQLGIIYKEKFKEFELSKAKFETVLDNTPEDRLILPSKYNLYRIYVQLGLNNKANLVKADILNNYSDSRYAEILLNPQSELSKDKNSPEYIYTILYKQFLNQEYAAVIDKAETEIIRLEGDDFVPKFELLKASAKGRLFGFEAYKEGVNYVALNYANSDEGKKAQDIVKNAFPALSKKEFISNDASKNFNVIYQFNKNENTDAFIKLLNEEIEKINYYNLTTSKDVYNQNTIFVVVHGIKSSAGAKGFSQLLRGVNIDADGKPKKPKITKSYFAISSENYTIVQRHKNLNVYLESN